MTDDELHAIRKRCDWDPDSVFVEAARDDIPKLLAEVERLRAAVERARTLIATTVDPDSVSPGWLPVAREWLRDTQAHPPVAPVPEVPSDD